MKNWLIIGSVAMHHWLNNTTKQNDIDIISAEKLSGRFIESHHWGSIADRILEMNKDPIFLDPEMCLTLKYSHAPWNVHWDKTMNHIWQFQKAGYSPNQEIAIELRKVWKEIHGAKKVNLKQDLSEFFSHDAVKRKYPHELVHEMVAMYGRPMHEQIRPDLNSVWCSKDMFDELSYEKQLACALEEIMAVAIERKNLSLQSSDLDIIVSMKFAFKQLITSMTTGWFNDFMILNAFELHRMMRTHINHVKMAIVKLENEYGI